MTILLLFFMVFGREACDILTPQPGMEPTLSALKGKVLTTGPPGKSRHHEDLLSFLSEVWQRRGVQSMLSLSPTSVVNTCHPALMREVE